MDTQADIAAGTNITNNVYENVTKFVNLIKMIIVRITRFLLSAHYTTIKTKECLGSNLRNSETCLNLVTDKVNKKLFYSFKVFINNHISSSYQQ